MDTLNEKPVVYPKLTQSNLLPIQMHELSTVSF